jgi:hypothetical protein
MPSISIVLILLGLAIFAAGYVTARLVANHRCTRDRLRQALRGAINRKE